MREKESVAKRPKQQNERLTLWWFLVFSMKDVSHDCRINLGKYPVTEEGQLIA